ncbi:MAG: EFR1 family ferrodoxin [Coriobacteriales bacterium]
MILYFSATGNTLAVAKEIAAATGDKLVDIGACYKKGRFTLGVRQGEDLGVVFPVYRWSTPRIVDEFMRKAVFATDDGEPFAPGYCYAVVTYGYFPGAEADYLDALLAKSCGLKLDASFEVPTVANCLYVSNPPSPEKQARINEAAERAAGLVAERIAAGERTKEAHGRALGRMLSKFTGTEEKERSTSPFNVIAERCTGCGTCASVCPTNTIALVDGHPVWSGQDCTECLACLHRCPEEASQYGKVSKGRRRYLNPVLRA